MGEMGWEERAALAKEDPAEMDRLLRDYLPFIRAQLASFPYFSLEYADMESIAMMTFAGCVSQYDGSRGNFFPFARSCIRNRLIDEERRHRNQPFLVPLEAEPGEPDEVGSIALQEYDKEMERQQLHDEIDALSEELLLYGISLGQLPDVCPRRSHSRIQCASIAQYCLAVPALKNKLMQQHRLPQQELARAVGVSVKTVEKHRKYIITLAVTLMGDYPCIRAFLPQPKEVTL